jgi:N-acetyltransferase 10
LQAILLGIGLQHRSVDELSTELALPVAQLLGLFNRTMRKLATCLRGVLETNAAHVLALPPATATAKELTKEALPQSLQDELESAAQVGSTLYILS